MRWLLNLWSYIGQHCYTSIIMRITNLGWDCYRDNFRKIGNELSVEMRCMSSKLARGKSKATNSDIKLTLLYKIVVDFRTKSL